MMIILNIKNLFSLFHKEESILSKNYPQLHPLLIQNKLSRNIKNLIKMIAAMLVNKLQEKIKNKISQLTKPTGKLKISAILQKANRKIY